MNGREWLARQMTEGGLRFRQQANCFVEVEDFARAQALFDQQLRVNWNSMMNRLTRTYHPTHRQLFAGSDQTLGELTTRLCQPVEWQGRRVRALSPLSLADTQLLQAVSRGEFAIGDFRNRDLRAILYGEAADVAAGRRQSGAVTRRIRLLRAHGLIVKIPKTQRYQLTAHGRLAIAALLQAQKASAAQLQKLAA